MILALLSACTDPVREWPEPVCRTTVAVRTDGVVVEEADCGRLDLTVRAIGEGDLVVRLDLDDGAVLPRVDSTTGGVLRAVLFEGTFEVEGEEPLRLWRQGYQSWSWSGVLDPVPLERDAEGIPVAGGDGQAFSTVEETGATSWWVGLAGHSDGTSAVIGAAGAGVLKFVVGWDEGTVVAAYGGRGEAVAIEPGGSLSLDPLFLGLGHDPQAVLEEYADRVAAHTGARAPSAPPPVGFGTWYQYYSDVTEEDVRANIDVAAALPDGLAPLGMFEIDDGWQVRWGDWTANERFPSGMAALAADIEAAGMVPGVWMAPFYVSRSAPIYAEHADWWVRDEAGQELTFTNLGSDTYVIVDVTVPEAADWMAEQVADRVEEGFGFLKLDFLYAGAVEGVRREPVTGMQAYHLGMQRLRAASRDAFLLACGAPILPSVGYADGMRTGADIAFEVSPDPDAAFLRWQLKNTAARGWMNGRWWWNDADQVIVRAPFDEVQAAGAIAATAASGGLWLLGDDLGALDEARLAMALDPELVAGLGGTPRPLDPLRFPSGLDAGPPAEQILGDDTAPVTWLLGDGRVVLVNLGPEVVDAVAPPGTELLSGHVESGPTVRALAPGAGEVWDIGR